LIHDPNDEADVGDIVLFEKSRPYSKRKHWIYRATLKHEKARQYLKDNPHVLELLDKSVRKEKEEQEAPSGRIPRVRRVKLSKT